MVSQQSVGLLASMFTGFLVATYLLHNESQVKAGLKDAAALARLNWSAGDGSPELLVDAAATVSSPRPFNVSFSYPIISDLLTRLSLSQKSARSAGSEPDCYSAEDLTRDVVDHWSTRYDFKSREAHLNRHPQFLLNVQGLDIHYYHVKPTSWNGESDGEPRNDSAVVLVLHGWPSSPAEFVDLVTELTSKAFEVVVPSLPGFGFSSAPEREDLGPVGIAHLMRNLMISLGHAKFLVQGNDLGAEIAANMAVLYPENVVALHSTMCRATPTSIWVPIEAALLNKIPWLIPEPSQRELVSSLRRTIRTLYRDDGHVYLGQPVTSGVLGRSLEDSPAALATQVLSRSPARPEQEPCGPRSDLDLDTLVDNLMFYWVPRKIESSLRLFAAFESDRKYNLERVPIEVPSACVGLRTSRNRLPETLLRNRFRNLQRYTDRDTGAPGCCTLASPGFAHFLAGDVVDAFPRH